MFNSTFLKLTIVTSALLFSLGACSDNGENGLYVGYVEADWVYVAASSAGRIETINVAEGQSVAAGQILFALDSERERAAFAQAQSRIVQAAAQARDLDTGAREPEREAVEAQLEEARARLRQAQLDYDRIMPLVADGIESHMRGDQIEANLRTARAQVKNAAEQIEIANLAARPDSRNAATANVKAAEADGAAAEYALSERSAKASVAGTVSDIFHEPGEFAAVGAAVIALLPDDGLKVRFFVPQDAVVEFPVGRQIEVAADGSRSNTKANVSFVANDPEFTPPVIYSRNSRGKLVFLVEATLPPDTDLLPGLPVDVIAP